MSVNKSKHAICVIPENFDGYAEDMSAEGINEVLMAYEKLDGTPENIEHKPGMFLVHVNEVIYSACENYLCATVGTVGTVAKHIFRKENPTSVLCMTGGELSMALHQFQVKMEESIKGLIMELNVHTALHKDVDKIQSILRVDVIEKKVITPNKGEN